MFQTTIDLTDTAIAPVAPPEAAAGGDTADLVRLLRLVRMPSSTRVTTIHSLRAIRDALHGPEAGGEVAVEVLRASLGEPAALRADLGDRATQILSDARRALRLWDDGPMRALALRLRGGLPMLSDAAEAAGALFAAEEAGRTVEAIRRFALWQEARLEDLPASAVALEPLLRRARPEDFGVSARKSLDNMRARLRKAVALVDPAHIAGREADLRALSPLWREVRETLCARLPAHAKAPRAILSRLAVAADRHGLAPGAIGEDWMAGFVRREQLTHAPSHGEKLRAAASAWDEAREKIGASTALAIGSPQRRLPDVAWASVPAAIRESVDARLADARPTGSDVAWSALIPDEDDLGLGALTSPEIDGTGLFLREDGTLKNWRDAIKRTWHAAAHDPEVSQRPERIEDLYRQECLVALVRAVRSARRDRCKAEGRNPETALKGRYECSLVQALLGLGRALDLGDDVLRAAEAMAVKLDPSVIGLKRQPDGSVRHVYETRRIGRRHEDMLRQFADDGALIRWLKAPDTLWTMALRRLKAGEAPTARCVALARSAITLRLAQRVAPLRRENHARLRIGGTEPHIQLPVGEGEGWLRIPARELKNLKSVTVRIDPDTVRMLRLYCEELRPVALEGAGAGAENPHLWPGAALARPEMGGAFAPWQGYITLESFAGKVAQHLRRWCALDMDLHVTRHLAGKIILDLDPGAMALVQQVLGHKKIETTQAYYAEVNGIVAQRRYLDLLDQATRRALGDLRFRFEET